MKKTTIYVASKPEAFSSELSDIPALMQRLNNCYIEKGLYFSLITNDYIKRAIGLGYEQDEKDKLLNDASIALFLFGSEVDKETLVELNEALELSKKSGWPKIAVYFKSPPDEQGDSYDIKALKGRLTVDTNFYYNVYGHTDTLVLGLMMQIKQLKLPGMDIKLENGKVYQGSEALLLFENAEIVSGYEELQRLKAERAELESGFYAAKSKHAENPDDAGLFEKFCEAAKKRGEANKAIIDIENQLYQMLDGMFEQTAKGRLSKRQVEGYRLIERGNLSAARQILDFDEILSDARRDEAIVEEAAERAQVNVNELLQLKDVNAAMLDWEAVDACFREAARLEEKHNLPRKAALEFMRFLFRQMQFDRAIELGENLRRHFEGSGSHAEETDKSKLYQGLGLIYIYAERPDDAEPMLNAALAIRKVLTEGDPDEIQNDISTTYSTLGILYMRSGKNDEAVRVYNAALEIREGLARRNPDKYEENLPASYINFGNLFNNMERYEEAVENISASHEILHRLIHGKKNQELERILCISYTVLGSAFTQMERFDEAEGQFNAALELLYELAESNPEAYGPRIANVYQELGSLHTKTKRYAEAEEKLNSAFKMFDRYMANSDAFETDLAEVLLKKGALFGEMKRFAEAEKALSSSIRLLEKYKESNPVYAEMMSEAQELLGRVNSEQSSHLSQDMINAGLTQAEVNVARLLLNGESRSYITRYLHISAADYDMLEKSIRLKMNAVGSRDITIAAVAEKYKLTGREADMLRYLGRNAGNDVIAAELHLTDVTVRKHIRNLLTKLSIDGRQEVAGWLERFNK